MRNNLRVQKQNPLNQLATSNQPSNFPTPTGGEVLMSGLEEQMLFNFNNFNIR